VLGAPSSPARAVKAAELLEAGFTRDGLSWLTSSLGTVESLAPIDAAPPNLHEEICGSHRKKPAVEEEEAAGGEDLGAEAGTPFSVLLSSLRAPTPKGAALLSDQSAAPPIVVYTGPTRTPSQIAALSAIEEAAPHHKKKGGKTEGKTAAKPADEEATDGNKPRVKWTPTSSSTLATTPPPELEPKPAAETPKKKPNKAAKADPANKPAATTAPAQ
jgi:D-alanyl-D-alanine carboxypeptidase